MIQGKLAELYVDIVARGQLGPALAEVQARATNLRAQVAASGTAGWAADLKRFMDLQRQVAIGQQKLSNRAGDVALKDMDSPYTRRQLKDLMGLQKEAEIQATKMNAANLAIQTEYIGSDKGTKQVKDQIDAQKKLAEEQKKLARAMDLAALGKFGLMLKDAREGFNKMAEQVATVGSVFPIAMAGMTGMVAAASPDAFKTFTMSMQYLAASVGETLLPTFVEVIRLVQQAARWFQNLDDGTKRMIGSVALWTIGISGAAYGLTRLIGLVRMLNSVFLLLARNPAFLVLGSIAAIAGAIALSPSRTSSPSVTGSGRTFGVGDAADIAADVSRGIADAMHMRGGRVDRRPDADMLPGPPPGGDWLSRTFDVARRISPDTGRPRPEPTSSPTSPITTALGVASERGGVLGRIGALVLSTAAVGGDRTRTLGAPTSDARPARTDPVLLASNFQSQFLGIEQQWKSLQQMAASDSPLEAEMRLIATRSRDYLESIAGSTATIAGRPTTPPTRT